MSSTATPIARMRAFGRSVVLAATLAIGVAGCATFESQTPQEKLDSARATVAALELGYSTICGVTPTPDFCSDPTAVAAKAKAEAALNTALDGAQAAINANNGTLTQADEIKLFTDIANDISQFETVVNEVKTKKARKHTS